jgi:hypothetical protein
VLFGHNEGHLGAGSWEGIEGQWPMVRAKARARAPRPTVHGAPGRRPTRPHCPGLPTPTPTRHTALALAARVRGRGRGRGRRRRRAPGNGRGADGRRPAASASGSRLSACLGLSGTSQRRATRSERRATAGAGVRARVVAQVRGPGGRPATATSSRARQLRQQPKYQIAKNRKSYNRI